MPIIPQTLSINNLGTTSAKSVDLHTIRKLVEYSLNNLTSMFALIVLEILLFDIITHPAGTGSEGLMWGWSFVYQRFLPHQLSLHPRASWDLQSKTMNICIFSSMTGPTIRGLSRINILVVFLNNCLQSGFIYCWVLILEKLSSLWCIMVFSVFCNQISVFITLCTL